MTNTVYDQNCLEPVTPTTRLRRAAPQLVDVLGACCEYVEKFGELSEAPIDSDCWGVLRDARKLLAEMEANSRLIAAAPALLTHLRDMTRLLAGMNWHQHAGLGVAPGEWSDAYAATTAAYALLDSFAA